MTIKIKLDNVTLCCVTSVDKEAHERSLAYSQRGIEFGAVKLLDLNTKNIDEWNKAIVYDLGEHIDTDYCLLIHSDGFVVNPTAWNGEWLKYDYIGSPWPLPTDDYSYRDINGVVQRVGNSVSLRSKKLLDLPKKLNMEWKSYYGNTNEDGYICVNMRHVFEEHGCTFAPFEEALMFGREVSLPENEDIQPFVFHRYSVANDHYPRFKDL
jgi:hypothetical protein